MKITIVSSLFLFLVGFASLGCIDARLSRPTGLRGIPQSGEQPVRRRAEGKGGSMSMSKSEKSKSMSKSMSKSEKSKGGSMSKSMSKSEKSKGGSMSKSMSKSEKSKGGSKSKSMKSGSMSKSKAKRIGALGSSMERLGALEDLRLEFIKPIASGSNAQMGVASENTAAAVTINTNTYTSNKMESLSGAFPIIPPAASAGDGSDAYTLGKLQALSGTSPDAPIPSSGVGGSTDLQMTVVAPEMSEAEETAISESVQDVPKFPAVPLIGTDSLQQTVTQPRPTVTSTTTEDVTPATETAVSASNATISAANATIPAANAIPGETPEGTAPVGQETVSQTKPEPAPQPEPATMTTVQHAAMARLALIGESF